MSPHIANSGIRDNHSRGAVADFFREHIKGGISEAYCLATLATFRDLARENGNESPAKRKSRGT